LILMLIVFLINWRAIFFNYQINFLFIINFIFYFFLFLK
jgi:hypothetical protein